MLDRGYDSNGLRARLAQRGIEPIIPAQKNQVAGEGFFRSTLATARSRLRIAAGSVFSPLAEMAARIFLIAPSWSDSS